MFQNYLKSAWRNIYKRKEFSVLNILGLSVGMAACLLILQYVNYEKSYDNFHPDLARLYRLNVGWKSIGESAIEYLATNHPAAGLALKRDFHQIEEVTRLVDVSTFFGSSVMSYEVEGLDPKTFYEDHMYIADPTVFKMFAYPLIKGDASTALADQKNVVITESMVKKYFGDEDPIGKILSLNGQLEVKVTGVLKDLPGNSHLSINALFSSTIFSEELDNNWIWPAFYTYVKLAPNTVVEDLENQFGRFVNKYLGEVMKEFGIEEKMQLQLVRDIHLSSNLVNEARENGSHRIVSFLMLVAVMILVIAWINFINLSTSRSLERASEVGIRKVIGARKGHIIGQFLMESALTNILAILMAILLVALATPYFNELVGHPVMGERWMTQIWQQATTWRIIMLLFLGGTFLAGLYPAFVLSSFQPLRTIKGKIFRSGKGFMLRHVLVVFQFVVSMLMIAGTLIVFKQLSFMRHQEMGFNMDQLLIVKSPSIRDSTLRQKFLLFREQLIQEFQIHNVTASSDIPGHIFKNVNSIKRKEQNIAESFFATYQITDENYLPTYELNLLAGRNFAKERIMDENAVILSESAVQMLGYNSSEEVLGQLISRKYRNWEDVTVIGVVKDINHRSLTHEQTPFAFFNIPSHPFDYYSIRISRQNLSQTIASIEQAFNRLFPRNPFEHFFLDDYFDKQYQADRQFGRIFSLFAGLAILVACLGLFGLASYVTARRTKETGVRKILGASAFQILILLGKQFVWLVLIAAIVGIPLAWWSGNQWLSNYAYRIELDTCVFILPVLLVLLIAILTVTLQSSKAVWTNPVKSLREE